MKISILKGDKVADNADYSDAMLVNYSPVMREVLGGTGYITSEYGLTLHANGTGIDRGGYFNRRQNTHFRVSGTDLISVDPAGPINLLGVITGSDTASFANSFNTQAVVADGKLWLYDGVSLNRVTDSDLGSPISITWVDGYYFMTDGNFLFHTDITDETSIDPLKFATSEFSPDPTYAVDTTSDDQVIVFNRFSTEYFINQALENFAFQRIVGKSVKCGVVGTHAFTEVNGTYYVVGGGRWEQTSVHVMSSGTYSSIASREVDKILGSYNEDQLSTLVMESRVEDQQKILIIHLPSHTLKCNLDLMQSYGKEYAWNLLKTDITGDIEWRGKHGVYDQRVPGWIYGDKISGNIGLLDSSVATHYGETVESLFYSPLLDLETLSVDQLMLETNPGDQISASDTTCAVSITYNGKTYGKEWFKLYGEQYNYDTRFILNRLGYVRDKIGFKFRVAAPERTTFTYIDIMAR